MSNLEDFLADLIGPDTSIVLGDTGVEMTLSDFLTLASVGAFDDDDVTPPKRDSADYREAITSVATSDSLEHVINALKCLHADYGWRAVLDVMAEWIGQIERAALTQDDRYRDLTGTVDLRMIIVVDADEEQRLRIAADKKEKYVTEEGLAPHLAFQKGLAETEAGIELTSRWYPHFRAALAAAHTTHDRRSVIAELFKAPFRADPDELIKGAMVLGTAAYGVRHHEAMSARFEEVADGREASTDPTVAPGWNSGGGYMRRTALRSRR